MNKKNYISSSRSLFTLFCFFVFSIGLTLPINGQVFDDGNAMTTSDLSGSVPSLTLSGFAIPDGKDKILMVTVNWLTQSTSPAIITNLTYNGQSLIQATTGSVPFTAATNGYSAIWYMPLGSGCTSIVNDEITVSFNQPTLSTWLSAITFQNVDQATPISNTMVNPGMGTSATINLPTSSGNMVVDAILATGAVDADPSQTELFLSGGGASASFKIAGTPSTTMTWAIDPVPLSPPYIQVAAELKECTSCSLFGGVPMATATSSSITCVNPTSTLDGTGSTMGANITYDWTKISGSGNLIGATNNTMAFADGPGVYRLTVTDNVFGCEDFEDVIVTSNTDEVISDNNGRFTRIDDGSATGVMPNFIVPEGCDRLLAVSVNWISDLSAGGADMVTEVSYNGENLFQAVEESNVLITPVNLFTSIWYLPLGSGCEITDFTGSDSNIVVKLNNTSTNILYIGAVTFQNVDQISPIGNINTNTGASTVSSININGGTDNFIIDAIMTASTVIPHISQMPVYTDPGSGSGSSLEAGNGGTVSMDWTQSFSFPFAHVAAELVNCSTCATFPVAPMIAAISTNTVNCTNATSTLDGTGSSTGANITYEWTKVSGTGNLVGATDGIMATADGMGVFKLTVTNTDTNCSEEMDVTVVEDFTLPIVATSATIITCTTPTSTLDGTGSSTTNTTYEWTKVSGIGEFTSATNGIMATVDGPGVFQLTTTNTISDCTADMNIVVTEDGTVPVSISTASMINCMNPTSTLDGTGSDMGANITYSWTKISGIGNLVGSTDGIMAMADGAGVFRLTVTNTTLGCFGRSDVTVISTLDQVTSDNNGVVGNGDGDAFDGEIDGDVTASISNFEIPEGCDRLLVVSVEWISDVLNGGADAVNSVTYGGQNLTEITTISSNLFPPTTVNTSMWYLTLGSGCALSDPSGLNSDIVATLNNTSTVIVYVSASTYQNVDQPAPIGNTMTMTGSSLTPSLMINGASGNMIADAIMAGQFVTAGAGQTQLITTNPGSGASSSYEMGNGGMVTMEWDQISMNPYVMAAAELVNCTSCTTFPTPPTIAGSSSDINCNNATSTLDGTGSSTGMNFTYEWTKVSGTGNLVGATNAIMATADGAGVFKLTVTDTDTNCSEEMDVTVVEDFTPPTVVVSASVRTCTTPTSTLDGTGSSFGPNFDYAWTKVSGIGELVGATDGIMAMADGIGVFKLTVTNTSNGCTAEMNVTVTEDATIPVSAAVASVIDCMNPVSNLDGTFSDMGANITYSWTKVSGSGNLVGPTDDITAIADGTGVFRLTVTNTALGCSGKSDVVVTTALDAVIADNNGVVGKDATGTNDGDIDGDVTASIPNFVVPDGCSRMLVVSVNWIANMIDGGADAVTSVTYGGQNLVEATSASGNLFPPTTANTSIWYLPLGSGCAISDPTGATTNIVATLNNTSTIIVYVSASTYQNVDQTNPIGNIASNTGSSMTPSLNIGSGTGNMIIDAIMAGQFVTAGANQTQLYMTNPGSGSSSSYEVGNGGIVTMEWDQITANPFAHAAIELVNCSTCTFFPAPPMVMTNASLITCSSMTSTLDGTGSSTGANITYEWMKVSGAGNLVGPTDGLMATADGTGTFRLIVKDTDTNCINDSEVTVMGNFATPTAMGISSLINCINPTSTLDGAGSSTVNVTYEWTKVSGVGNLVGAIDGITATADGAGVFKLTVTNISSGCTDDADITVTADIASPTVTTTASNITCTVSTSTLDGTGSDMGANFTYSWTKVSGVGNLVGATDGIMATADGIGVFKLTVTDMSNGCTNSSDVTVMEDMGVPTVIVTASNITCTVSTSTLDGTGSDMGANFTYSWTKVSGVGNLVGATDGIMATVDGIGEFTLTVTNTTTGCIKSVNVTVVEDKVAPTVAATASNITCVNSTSTLDGMGSDMGANFTYSWTKVSGVGNLVGATDGITATADDTGVFKLTVTNTSNGCTAEMDATVVEDKVAPTVAATASNITCTVSTSTLDGTGSDMGVNFTYSWTKVSGIGNLVGATDGITATADGTGVFKLTVTNTSNGCTAEMDATVIEDMSILTVVAAASVIDCANSMSVLDGTGSSVGAGITYSWTKVSGVGNLVGATDGIMAMADGVGVFRLTVMNTGLGCSEQSDATVTTALDGVIADNNGVVGKDATGTNDGDIDGDVTASLPNFVVPEGCSRMLVVSVNWIANMIDGGADAVTSVTYGGQNLVEATSASGNLFPPTTANTSMWYLPLGSGCAISDPTGATTNIVATLNNTSTIIVYVSASTYQNVDQTNPIGNVASNTGSSMTPSLNIGGGTGNMVVDAIMAGQFVTAGANQTQLYMTNPGSGSSSSYEAGNGGMVAMEWDQITANPFAHAAIELVNCSTCTFLPAPPVAMSTASVITCSAMTSTLDGTGSSTVNVTYEWTKVSGVGNLVGATDGIMATADGTGVFRLTVKDTDTNCTAESDVTVMGNFATPTATGVSTLVNCINTTSTLDGTGSSTVNVTYEWTKVSGVGNLVGATDGITATADGAGIFKLTVTNISNGCTDDADITVTADIASPTVATAASNITCTVSTSTLDGTGSDMGANFTYSWTKVSGVGNLVGATDGIMATADGIGVFKLTVTNMSNGCTNSSDVTVMEDMGVPTVIVTATDVTCVTSTSTLDGTGSDMGANFTYSWTKVSGVGNLVGATDGITATADGLGEFMLTVTNTMTGCVKSVNVTVVEDKVAPTVATAATDITCTNTTSTLDGAGSGTGVNFTYAWTKVSGNGDLTGATDAITATADGTGVFNLMVTNTTNGCTANMDVTVNIDTIPPTAMTSASLITCTNATSTLEGTGSSTSNVTYAWTKVSGSGDLVGGTSGIAAIADGTGEFMLTVTNTDNGCTATSNVTVTEDITAPMVSANASVITCTNPTSTLDGAGSDTGANFTYAWTKVSGNGDLTGATDAITATADGTGVFNLIVTNTTNGCTSDADVTVTEDGTLPIVGISASEINCMNNVATLDGTSSSAGANFTYLWTKESGVGNFTSGITNNSITVDGVGMFKLTVINITNGCSVDSTVTVTETLPPFVSVMSQANIGCFGDSTGAVTVSTIDGKAPFNYIWSNGSDSTTITDLVAGNYGVTVTDADGCIAITSTMVTQTDSLGLATSSSFITMIGGGDGSATVQPSGGTPPYEYLWSNDSTTQQINDLLSGYYSVTVTDDNDCQDTTGVLVYEILQVQIEADTVPFCEGDDLPLTAMANRAVTYKWNTGSTIANTFANSTGFYVVTVTDDFGNTATTELFVEALPLPDITITPDGANQFCEGGDVTLTATGGVSYMWDDPNNTNGPSVTVSQTNGYTVTVTDSNGCSNIQTFAVEVYPLPNVDIQAANGFDFCEGETITLEAVTDTIVDFFWSTMDTNLVNITLDETSTVTLIVQDGNGCTNSVSTTVTERPLPTAMINPGTLIEFCKNTLDSIDLQATGGVDYLWSTGQDTQTVRVFGENQYSVTVTDAFGCTDTESTEIVVYNIPTAAITAFGDVVFCDGGSVNLEASGGLSYEWSSGETSQLITATDNTVYTVTVTDANGCTDTESQTVETIPFPDLILTPTDTSVCDGSTAILTAVTGGNNDIMWNTGETTPSIEVDATGVYSVVVTGDNSCSTTASTSFTVNPLPNVSVTPTDTLVQVGQMVNIQASGGVQFNWSDGSTNGNLAVLTTGSYTVTVTDANGCTGEATANVVVENAPTVSIDIDGSDEFCEGESATLTAIGMGVPPLSYEWSTGEMTSNIVVNSSGVYSVTVTDGNGFTISNSQTIMVNPLPDAPQISPSNTQTLCEGETVTLTSNLPNGTIWIPGNIMAQSIDVTTAGSYTAYWIDSNGCQSLNSAPVTVDVVPLPAAPIITFDPDTVVCAPEVVTLTSNYGFGNKWSNNSTDQSLVVAVGTQTYSVVHTDLNGCTSEPSDPVTVTIGLQPTGSITIVGDTVLCQDETVTLIANGGLNYAWNVIPSGTQEITVSSSGEYIVTITDANGCEDVVSQNITVNPLPEPEISINSVGDTLFSTPAISYQWYVDGKLIQGATNQWIVPTDPGEYTVEVVDDNGCTGISFAFFYSDVVEIDNLGKVEVFPVPAQTQLFVNLELTRQVSNINVKLYNLIGQEVYFHSIKPQSSLINHEIDLENLSSGNYYLQIEMDGQNVIQKVIKQ